ncbi:pectin lyase fold/virulence factor [Hysterangium stoloniferum]|nr:pectin lyase fold/virulence factor [Hysterangium stoloniferum]
MFFVNNLLSFVTITYMIGHSFAATCKVVPRGDGKDDHDGIVNAMKNCAHGGAVVLPAGNVYTLASPITADEVNALNLRGMTITINGDINYEYPVIDDKQDSVVYWTISGKNVDVGGFGTIKGHGQQWYNANFRGPKLMQLKINTGSLRDLTFNNGGGHMMIIGGTDFTVGNVTIHSVSNDYTNSFPHNTDGININGQQITVKNTDIIGGDDFFLILRTPLRCGGPTHGISVGTLGSEDPNGDDKGSVTNVLVENIEFYDGGDGLASWPAFQRPQFIARIKTYNASASTGTVSNVTWRSITANLGVSAMGKSPIYITQNHNNKGHEQVPGNSGINIKDITFSDISGGKVLDDDSGVVSITCSNNHQCHNIVLKNIDFQTKIDDVCTNVVGLDNTCEQR